MDSPYMPLYRDEKYNPIENGNNKSIARNSIKEIDDCIDHEEDLKVMQTFVQIKMILPSV